MRLLVPLGIVIALASLGATIILIAGTPVAPPPPRVRSTGGSVVHAFRLPITDRTGHALLSVEAGLAYPLQAALYDPSRVAGHRYAIERPRLTFEGSRAGALPERPGGEPAGAVKVLSDVSIVRATEGLVFLPAREDRPIEVRLAGGVELAGPAASGRLVAALATLDREGRILRIATDRPADLVLRPQGGDPGAALKARGGLSLDLLSSGELLEARLDPPVDVVACRPAGPSGEPASEVYLRVSGVVTVRPAAGGGFRLEGAGPATALLSTGTRVDAAGVVLWSGPPGPLSPRERAAASLGEPQGEGATLGSVPEGGWITLLPPLRAELPEDLAGPPEGIGAVTGSPGRFVATSEGAGTFVPRAGGGSRLDLPAGLVLEDRETGAVVQAAHALLDQDPARGLAVSGWGGVRADRVPLLAYVPGAATPSGELGYRIEGERLRAVYGRRAAAAGPGLLEIEVRGHPVRATRADGLVLEATTLTVLDGKALLDGNPKLREGPPPLAAFLPLPLAQPAPSFLLRPYGLGLRSRIESVGPIVLSETSVSLGKEAAGVMTPGFIAALASLRGAITGREMSPAPALEAAWYIAGPRGISLVLEPAAARTGDRRRIARVRSFRAEGVAGRPAAASVVLAPPGFGLRGIQATEVRFAGDTGTLVGTGDAEATLDVGGVVGDARWRGTLATLRAPRISAAIVRRAGALAPGRIFADRGTGEVAGRRVVLLLEGPALGDTGTTVIEGDRADYDPLYRAGVLSGRPASQGGRPVQWRCASKEVEGEAGYAVFRLDPGWLELFEAVRVRVGAAPRSPSPTGGEGVELQAPWVWVAAGADGVRWAEAGTMPPSGGGEGASGSAPERPVRVLARGATVEGPSARYERETGLLAVPDYRAVYPGPPPVEEHGRMLTLEVGRLEEVWRRAMESHP